MTEFKRDNDYSIEVFHIDPTPHIPMDAAEAQLLEQLKKFGMKDHHIKRIFHSLNHHTIVTLVKDTLDVANRYQSNPGTHLTEILRSNHGLNITQDVRTWQLNYVHDIQKTVTWLERKSPPVEWTYINIYARRTRRFLQRIYKGEAIPNRV